MWPNKMWRSFTERVHGLKTLPVQTLLIASITCNVKSPCYKRPFRTVQLMATFCYKPVSLAHLSRLQWHSL